MNFPGGPGVKNLPAVLGDKGSIPEDPTCCRATRPMCHNCWGPCTQSCAAQLEKPLQWETCTPQLDRRPCSPQLEKEHTATNTTVGEEKNNQPKHSWKKSLASLRKDWKIQTNAKFALWQKKILMNIENIFMIRTASSFVWRGDVHPKQREKTQTGKGSIMC